MKYQHNEVSAAQTADKNLSAPEISCAPYITLTLPKGKNQAMRNRAPIGRYFSP